MFLITHLSKEKLKHVETIFEGLRIIYRHRRSYRPHVQRAEYLFPQKVVNKIAINIELMRHATFTVSRKKIKLLCKKVKFHHTKELQQIHMTTITRFLKIGIPFFLVTNFSVMTENNVAIAKTACFSKNIYQEKSHNCNLKNRPNGNLNKAKLFSIYSSTQSFQNASKQIKVKPFRQWNKNLKPSLNNHQFLKELKKISSNKYPNITLISNGAGQHAITILSSAKMAMVKSRPSSPAKPPNALPSIAAFHIRCIDNKTSVMFEFPTTKLANSKASTEILYSIDNGPDYLLGLTASHSDNILGLWSGKQAVPFTSKILGKSSLHINVWDKESIEYAFTFNVSNLGKAIQNLRNACNW